MQTSESNQAVKWPLRVNFLMWFFFSLQAVCYLTGSWGENFSRYLVFVPELLWFLFPFLAFGAGCVMATEQAWKSVASALLACISGFILQGFVFAAEWTRY